MVTLTLLLTLNKVWEHHTLKSVTRSCIYLKFLRFWTNIYHLYFQLLMLVRIVQIVDSLHLGTCIFSLYLAFEHILS